MLAFKSRILKVVETIFSEYNIMALQKPTLMLILTNFVTFPLNFHFLMLRFRIVQFCETTKLKTNISTAHLDYVSYPQQRILLRNGSDFGSETGHPKQTNVSLDLYISTGTCNKLRCIYKRHLFKETYLKKH